MKIINLPPFRAPDLPQQLKWKFTHEPELLSWTIRARNYNTFAANAMFWFFFIIIIACTTFIHTDEYVDYPYKNLSTAIFLLTILFILTSTTHQRMNFAYRFTQSGIEYCKWKDLPKWMLPVLKWLTVFTAILFIFLATIDSAFLFGALVGPGGMGLMYLSMANSKGFRELHTHYHHYAFKWEEFTQLAIATNREVVDLKFTITLEGNDYETHWSLNIYCKRKQKELIAQLIKPYLSPGVPFIRTKIDVH